MLISTMNDLPGYEIVEVLGEVFGLTVHSRNVGSQFGAGSSSSSRSQRAPIRISNRSVRSSVSSAISAETKGRKA